MSAGDFWIDCKIFPIFPEKIIFSREEEFRDTRLCAVPNLFIGIELRDIAPQMLDKDLTITFFKRQSSKNSEPDNLKVNM
jgi:hypothetical protein